MSAFIPPSLLVSAAPLPNTPPLSTRGTAANQQASFSRQLEQSRQAHAQESPRPAPQVKPPPPPPPATTASRPPTKPEAGARNEAARASRPAPSRESAAPAEGESAKTATEADAAAQSDTEATDPTAAHLLAPMGPPPDAPAPADAALSASLTLATPLAQGPQPGVPATATGADAATTDATGLPGTASAGTRPEATGLMAQAVERDPRDPRDAAGAAPSEPGAWQQAQAAALAEASGGLRESSEVHRADAAVGPDRGLEHVGLTGPSGPGSHGLAGKATAGEVPTANLATPATSTEFRAALGAQVSIFARAGIQQAELHLNPADMGPVSIQIVLDGQQAQVNFGADSALTRQIIESGMPELAGALRDAGLTLTGGGVSQHAGGQRQDTNGNGAPGSGAAGVTSDTAADAAAGTPPEQARRSAARTLQGGVDVFA